MKQFEIKAIAQQVGIAGDTVTISSMAPFQYGYGTSAPSVWQTSVTGERTGPFVSDNTSVNPLWVKTVGSDPLKVSLDIRHPVNKSNLVYDMSSFDDEIALVDSLSSLKGLQATAGEIDTLLFSKQQVKQKNLISDGSSLLDVSTTTGITADVGTVSLNSTVTPFSNTSIEITAAASGGNVAFHKAVSGISLVSENTFSLLVKFADYTAFSQLSVRLGTGTYGQYKYAYALLKTKVSSKSGEWNNVSFNIDDLVMSGGMALTDEITYVQVHAQGVAGKTITLSVAGVFSNLMSRPAITFSFDDGNMSDYLTCYQVLKKYSFSGISYIISNDVGLTVNNGLDPRLTLTQMQEMYANGWNFGIHGKDSNNWTSTTLAVAEDSIKTCRNWLYTNGFKRTLNHCAYPENQYNDDIITILTRYGIKYARTTNEFPQYSPIETFSKIKLGFPIKATLQENIDLLESRIRLGGLVNIYGHAIYDDRTVTPTIFEQFVDYINTHYSRYVTTIPQWCKDYETGTVI